MSNKKILITDDELAILKVLSRLLSSQGYRVETASSVAEAEQLLQSFQPDLLITDYVMPGEDGLSFLSRLSSSHPTLIRVLLTGFADTRTAVKAINQAHVHYFIVKPFEGDEILQVVRDLFAAYIPPKPAAPRGETEAALDRLLQAHPGIDSVRRNTGGYILLDEDLDAMTPPNTQDFESFPDLPRDPAPAPAPRPVKKAPEREPTYFRNLKAEHPDIDRVNRDENGYIVVDDDELDGMFPTNEYVRPAKLQKRPEARLAAQKSPPPEGSKPLDEWMDKTSDYGNPRSSKPREENSEIVFDEALLKLIGV